MSCQEIGYPYFADTGHHKYTGEVADTLCGKLEVTSNLSNVLIDVSQADDHGRADGRTDFCREYLTQAPTDVTLIAPLSWSDQQIEFEQWIIDGVPQSIGDNVVTISMDDECHVAKALYNGIIDIIDPQFGACCREDGPPPLCYMTDAQACLQNGDYFDGNFTCDAVPCTGHFAGCCSTAWPLYGTISANWNIQPTGPTSFWCCSCTNCPGGCGPGGGGCCDYLICPPGYQNESSWCAGAGPAPGCPTCPPCEQGTCGQSAFQKSNNCCGMLTTHRTVIATGEGCWNQGKGPDVRFQGVRCLGPNNTCTCGEDCPPPMECFTPPQHTDGSIGCSGGPCCNKALMAYWPIRSEGFAHLSCNCLGNSLVITGQMGFETASCGAAVGFGECGFMGEVVQSPPDSGGGIISPPIVALVAGFERSYPRAPGQSCSSVLRDIHNITTEIVSSTGAICSTFGSISLSF